MFDTLKYPLASVMLALTLTACGSGDAPETATAAASEDGHDDHDDTATQPKTDGHGDHGDEGGDDHGEAEEGSDTVRLSQSEAAAAGISTGLATLGSLNQMLSLPAEILFDADRVANVSPHVSGIITRLYAGEGDVVKRGQTLALVSSRELAGLKADYLTARSAEDLARLSMEREQALFADKITALADMQTAEANFAAAKATREASENKLHAIGVSHAQLAGLDSAKDGALANARISAPLSGTVVQRTVTLGVTVTAGDAGGEPLFMIVDDSVVWADIAVYKQDAGNIHPGQAVTIMTSDGKALASGEIAFLLPVFDESSRTATARVIVDNSQAGLHPGQFVTAGIATAQSTSALMVPSAAVQVVEGRASVFVPTADGFTPRVVKPGREQDGSTEILSGLEPGEEYVTAGAFTLRAQLEKTAFGDGHGH